eukprot:scaffold13117_cov126-Amphora_coffeaeformis.AAC.2
MPAWNGCPRLPPMKVASLLFPSTVLVTLADEIIFHGNAGMEWLLSVAPNGGSHTPIAIYGSCGIGRQNHFLRSCWHGIVAQNEGSVTAIAIYSSCGIVAQNEGSVTAISIYSACGIVAQNEGTVTAIAIYSACDIDITQSCNAGMEWLPSIAPNEGSVTPIAIYSACGIVAQNEGSVTAIAIYGSCGIGITQSCTKILLSLV